ncbi:MAG: phosphate signaling complex protein PhoU [Candidatus Krumholzibacteriia bacterium]|nr:phosphate signaling complex protein PhoU [Candidatus Latescibacterota bacterium]
MAKHLHRDLAELSKDILTLGARVEESLDWAVRALLERREDLAAKVRAADVVIDRQEVEVEENCLKILALHQPVAADLRFVITALKVNNDLERMGDHAVSIAGRAAKLSQKQPLESAEDINRLAMKVRAMVKLSLGALIERDVATAREICAMDDEVDALHREMYSVLKEQMRESPQVVGRAVNALSVSRNLERIADLCTNIAEDVIFMVSGEVVRHGVLGEEHGTLTVPGEDED